MGCLRRAMRTSGSKRFIIDGFPRDMDQCIAFESSVARPRAVLFLDVDADVAATRLGGAADKVAVRFNAFVRETLPVVGRYESLGKLHRVSRGPSKFPDGELLQSVLKFSVTFPLLLNLVGLKLLGWILLSVCRSMQTKPRRRFIARLTTSSKAQVDFFSLVKLA